MAASLGYTVRDPSLVARKEGPRQPANWVTVTLATVDRSESLETILLGTTLLLPQAVT